MQTEKEQHHNKICNTSTYWNEGETWRAEQHKLKEEDGISSEYIKTVKVKVSKACVAQAWLPQPEPHSNSGTFNYPLL